MLRRFLFSRSDESSDERERERERARGGWMGTDQKKVLACSYRLNTIKLYLRFFDGHRLLGAKLPTVSAHVTGVKFRSVV